MTAMEVLMYLFEFIYPVVLNSYTSQNMYTCELYAMRV